MFIVAWQRLVLLGPHRIDRLPGLGWSARESAWLGHVLKVAGMTFLLMAIFMITIGRSIRTRFTPAPASIRTSPGDTPWRVRSPWASSCRCCWRCA